MDYQFFTLDVFTDTRFGGNPLAVVLDADGLDGKTMQTVAREFNLSETIFVQMPKEVGNTARVRIFTPARELPFAGHPTIGCAILLAQLGKGGDEIILEEGVGPVTVSVSNVNHAAPFAELSGAVMPKVVDGLPDHEVIAAAIGLTSADLGFDSHAPARVDAGNTFIFAPVRSREILARTKPSVSAWPNLQGADGVGIYVYCKGEGEADFHSRLFAPEHGILEDPATGSAAATLPGAFHAAGICEEGTNKWVVEQGEDMGRPSRLEITADVTGGKISAVKVGGQAVRVSKGTIEL